MPSSSQVTSDLSGSSLTTAVSPAGGHSYSLKALSDAGRGCAHPGQRVVDALGVGLRLDRLLGRLGGLRRLVLLVALVLLLVLLLGEGDRGAVLGATRLGGHGDARPRDPRWPGCCWVAPPPQRPSTVLQATTRKRRLGLALHGLDEVATAVAGDPTTIRLLPSVVTSASVTPEPLTRSSIRAAPSGCPR